MHSLEKVLFQFPEKGNRFDFIERSTSNLKMILNAFYLTYSNIYVNPVHDRKTFAEKTVAIEQMIFVRQIKFNF